MDNSMEDCELLRTLIIFCCEGSSGFLVDAAAGETGAQRVSVTIERSTGRTQRVTIHPHILQCSIGGVVFASEVHGARDRGWGRLRA